jgi:hypothetical protein
VTGHKIEDIIRMRYSCRSYREDPLSTNDRLNLSEFVSQKNTGPFGSSARFTLFAAESADSKELKGLGTYGFIKKPAAFVAGVVNGSQMNLEDFGYSMEKIILYATEIGLGSCWLGGSFKRSSFGEKAGISDGEIIPAVASIGYIAEKRTVTDKLIVAGNRSKKRKRGNELFFDSSINEININSEEGYGRALEMVRLAPSAANRQPWRVVKEDGNNIFHFFLERSASYTRVIKLLRYEDLQKIDMGIAMCHFEFTAIESGLKGLWKKESPVAVKAPVGWEYSITWEGE